MKVLFFLPAFLISSFLLAGPTMRLEGNDGYFVEATLQENSRLTAFTNTYTNCTGSYSKDMIAKTLTVTFDAGCCDENITIYFTDLAYSSFFRGSSVDVEFEKAISPGQRKTGIAWIIRR